VAIANIGCGLFWRHGRCRMIGPRVVDQNIESGRSANRLSTLSSRVSLLILVISLKAAAGAAFFRMCGPLSR